MTRGWNGLHGGKRTAKPFRSKRSASAFGARLTRTIQTRLRGAGQEMLQPTSRRGRRMAATRKPPTRGGRTHRGHRTNATGPCAHSTPIAKCGDTGNNRARIIPNTMAGHGCQPQPTRAHTRAASNFTDVSKYGQATAGNLAQSLSSQWSVTTFAVQRRMRGQMQKLLCENVHRRTSFNVISSGRVGPLDRANPTNQADGRARTGRGEYNTLFG